MTSDETNVTNGTIDIYGNSLCAKNLSGSGIDTVKVDGSGCFYPATLNSGDVSGIIANPLTEDLNGAQHNITNIDSIEINNGINSITVNYDSGITDQILDLQDVKDIDNATQNISQTTTSGQTDFNGDVTIQGDIQMGGALIGTLTINDIDTGGVQTDDLKVEVTNTSLATTVSNFPANQTVTVSNSSLATTVSNFPANQTVTVSNASLATTVSNFPANQTVTVSNASLATTVSNFPANQTVTVSNAQLQVQSDSGTIAQESTLNSVDTRLATLNSTATAISSKLDEKIYNYYSKGYSEDLASTEKVIGVPNNYNFPNLLTTDSVIQLSSTNAADLQDCQIFGYNSSNAKVSDTVTLTGQTPVTTTTAFFRIVKMVITTSGLNIGTVYASKNGSTTTAGAPNNLTDYLWSIKPGDGTSLILQDFIPYVLGHDILRPKYVSYSCANGANGNTTVIFELKKASSSIWLKEFRFFINLNSNTQFSFDLTGIPFIYFDFNVGMDVRIRAIKAGSGTTQISGALAIGLN